MIGLFMLYGLFESDRAAAGLPAHLKLASQLAGQ